jgi:hypothetical protein
MRTMLAMFSCLVSAAPAFAADPWHVPGDFATIQDAIDDSSVQNGDTILVGPGNHSGALVTKRVEIKGTGGAVIDSGPVHGSGLIQGFRLLAGSDGTSISHLTFTTDLSIMNGTAVNEVTVTQNTFLDNVQAVSNWRGKGWQISHNKIEDLHTRCGGGIGILVGDYAGGTVSDNVVSHNTVTGDITFPSGDCGGYSGTGIVIYADFRFGAAGSQEISYNRVVKNKVAVVLNDQGAINEVGAIAFELTDTDENPDVIVNNSIGFNDFRGSTTQIVLTPSDLNDVNDISRNFGDNRGHGLHPSLFGPGGN